MIIAIATADSEKGAKLVAKQAFAGGLASCVQISQVALVCHWQKEPREDLGYRLMFKTEKGKLAALEELVKGLCPAGNAEWAWWEANA